MNENQNLKPNNEVRTLTPQWEWLMREAGKLGGFGEARIIFHNGQPVEIIEILKRSRYGQGN